MRYFCGRGRVRQRCNLRTIQRLTDGAWVAIKWEDVRKGDRVRIAECDGVPAVEAVAEGDYDPTMGTGGFMGTVVPEVPIG